MNKMILISFALVAIFIISVNGHGRLLKPVNRGSAWRIFPREFPYVEQDETDMCDNSKKDRPMHCGVCGPVYKNDPAGSFQVIIRSQNYNKTHYSFEKGSRYYTGKPVATYKKGQTVETMIDINAGHCGEFEFRICNADGIEDPTDACFENNILSSTDGRKLFNQNQRACLGLPDDRIGSTILLLTNNRKMSNESVSNVYQIVLPPYLTCKHCIFQVN